MVGGGKPVKKINGLISDILLWGKPVLWKIDFFSDLPSVHASTDRKPEYILNASIKKEKYEKKSFKKCRHHRPR
jgi:hypothetical protein